MAYTETAAGKANASMQGEHTYGFDGISIPHAGIPHSDAAEKYRDRTRANEGVSASARRRRTVSRTPDMSKPRARAKAPSVEIGAGSAAAVAQRTERPQVRVIHETKHTPIPIGIILTAAVCTILFLVMINHFVEINESTIALSSMRTQLSGLISEERDLTLKLEKKNDLRRIEEYATTVLGMVKNDQLPKKYVSIGSEDKIEPTPEEESSGGLFDGAVDAFRDTIGEIVEYIG